MDVRIFASTQLTFRSHLVAVESLPLRILVMKKKFTVELVVTAMLA